MMLRCLMMSMPILSLISVAGWALPALGVPASGLTNDSIPGVAQPYCGDFAQQPLNRCIGRWLQVSEHLHELVYDEINVSLLETQQSELESIHQVWNRFRDEHCDLVAQQVLGGSAYPMLWGNCRASLTNERIAALQFWGDVTLDPDVAFQRLQELDMELQPDPDTDWNKRDAHWREYSRWGDRDNAPRYNTAQLLWLSYREAHCEFEATQVMANPYFPDIDELDDGRTYEGMARRDALELRCQTRLTIERLEHLKDLTREGW
ncbi:MAG: lysozyme inhibitor LprI family protein [Cyanobacteria bacterium P01_F01_bin.150]